MAVVYGWILFCSMFLCHLCAASSGEVSLAVKWTVCLEQHLHPCCRWWCWLVCIWKVVGSWSASGSFLLLFERSASGCVIFWSWKCTAWFYIHLKPDTKSSLTSGFLLFLLKQFLCLCTIMLVTMDFFHHRSAHFLWIASRKWGSIIDFYDPAARI